MKTLSVKLQALSIWNKFITKCVRYPVSLICIVASLGWALALLPAPEAASQPHIHMEYIMPLFYYGLVALGVAVVYLISLSGKINIVLAHAVGSCFWTFVALLFWTSGVSLTGKMTYTALAIATGLLAIKKRDYDGINDKNNK